MFIYNVKEQASNPITAMPYIIGYSWGTNQKTIPVWIFNLCKITWFLISCFFAFDLFVHGVNLNILWELTTRWCFIINCVWVSINDHPYSINSGYLVFFETTIMGKTDLAMIQKTNIDALHKEGKSQRVITERCGCLQSAVSKHIKCKVDWKEEFG